MEGVARSMRRAATGTQPRASLGGDRGVRGLAGRYVMVEVHGWHDVQARKHPLLFSVDYSILPIKGRIRAGATYSGRSATVYH